MKNYYFTFGSDERFPFQNTYLVVQADSIREATAIFKDRYPCRTEGVLNCAFYYSEEEWNESCASYYEGMAPAAVLGACKPIRVKTPVGDLIANIRYDMDHPAIEVSIDCGGENKLICSVENELDDIAIVSCCDLGDVPTRVEHVFLPLAN